MKNAKKNPREKIGAFLNVLKTLEIKLNYLFQNVLKLI